MKKFKVVLVLVSLVMITIIGCERPVDEITSNETKIVTPESNGPSSSTLDTGSFVDTRDMIKYKWVKIGGKTWMAENLRYLGTGVNAYLPNYIDYSEFPVGTVKPQLNRYIRDFTAARSNMNFKAYGLLYQDFTGIAPLGWHVATKAEWDDLLNIAAAIDSAGGVLKEAGTAYWSAPNVVSSAPSLGFNVRGAGTVINKYDDTSEFFRSR
jgi:uncharacterized protein (TIGR02145 family)